MKSIWILILLVALSLTACSYGQSGITKDLTAAINGYDGIEWSNYFIDPAKAETPREMLNGFSNYSVIFYSSSEDQSPFVNTKDYEISMEIVFQYPDEEFSTSSMKLECVERDCKFSELSIDKSPMIKVRNRDLITDSEISLNFANYLETPIYCERDSCETPIDIRNNLPEINGSNAKIYCNGEEKRVISLSIQDTNPCDEYKLNRQIFDAYCNSEDLVKRNIVLKGDFKGCDKSILKLDISGNDAEVTYDRYLLEATN